MTAQRGNVRVTHLDDNGTWLVALEGEHDLATIPLLDRETLHVWSGCTVVIVDLSAATFIDCTVVGWLTRTRGALASNATGKGALRVVIGASPSIVRRVFEVLRLHDEFACYETRRAASTSTETREPITGA